MLLSNYSRTNKQIAFGEFARLNNSRGKVGKARKDNPVYLEKRLRIPKKRKSGIRLNPFSGFGSFFFLTFADRKIKKNFFSLRLLKFTGNLRIIPGNLFALREII